MSVVQAIARTETDARDRPVTAVVIERIAIRRAGWIGDPPGGPLEPRPGLGE